MALLHTSIQKYSITIAAGTSSTQTDLDSGTDITDCVPFITVRMGDDSEVGDDVRTVRVVFDTGTPPTVTVSTNSTGTNRTLIVELTVVEFDPAEVTVQAVDYSNGGNKTITSVVSANSFIVNTYTHETSTGDRAKTFIRSDFDTGTNPTVVQMNAGASSLPDSYAGTFYVVESINSGFTVQHNGDSPDQLTGTSGTVTLGSTIANLAQTMLICNIEADNGTSYTNTLNPHFYLSDADTISWGREASTYGAYLSYFVVEFASADQQVQRGIESDMSSTSKSITIATVNDSSATTDSAMGHVPMMQNLNAASGGTAQTDNPAAMFALDVETSTSLRAQRNNDASISTNDLAWEVVEWDHVDVAGGPARRVMVTS